MLLFPTATDLFQLMADTFKTKGYNVHSVVFVYVIFLMKLPPLLQYF